MVRLPSALATLIPLGVLWAGDGEGGLDDDIDRIPDTIRIHPGQTRAPCAIAIPPEVAKLEAIVAVVDTEPVVDPMRLVRTNLASYATLSVRASSQLAAQGKASYGAANAVDHDAASAWCEGA